MSYSLSLRPRALAEVKAARDRYALVGHGASFVEQVELGGGRPSSTGSG